MTVKSGAASKRPRDIEQLQAFDRIVRDGSFSRAALALNITQPTISARIQGLEQAVGGPLFLRGGRAILLTELGESFLPYARRALAVLAEEPEAAGTGHSGGNRKGEHGCSLFLTIFVSVYARSRARRIARRVITVVI